MLGPVVESDPTPEVFLSRPPAGGVPSHVRRRGGETMADRDESGTTLIQREKFFR